MERVLRILILEDNQADADLIEFELQEAEFNFTAKRVMTEKEFVHAIVEFLPDLILSDYDLPQYNGAWALAEAKTLCPDVPFILVTGALDEERAIDMLTSGAKDYVMKNRFHRLVPAVRRVLKEAEEIKANKNAQMELLEAHRTLESKVKERTKKLRKEIRERKKIEKAQRESEEKYKELISQRTRQLEAANVQLQAEIAERKKAQDDKAHLALFPLLNPNPVIEADLNGQIYFINPSAEQLLPDLPERGLKHPWLADWETVVKAFQKNGIKNQVREVDIDGNMYLQSMHFVEETGRIRIYGIDITVRQKAEIKLLESKKKIQTILESITDIYIAYDHDWRFTDMNSQMEKILGRCRDELIGKVFWEVFPQMKDGDFFPQFQRAVAKNKPVHFEAKAIFGRWFETHAYPSEDGLSVYFRDITQRKETEDALRESKERFATTLASIGDAVIATGIEGKIDFMNAIAEELTGWKFEDASQKQAGEVFRIINEQTRREVESPIKRVLKTGMIIGLANHTILVRKDNTEVAIDDSGAPIKDQQGKIIGVVLVFRDITERRKREANLQRLNRTLVALSNSSQAMLRANDESAYMKEICRIIMEDCGHAMVWIGFAEDDEDKSVRPISYAGFEEGYLETLKITWADTERGHGPTGTAIRTGKPSSCRNMLTDPQFQPWRAEAKKRGYASSTCLPLMFEGKAFGALTIYSREPDAFTQDEVNLLSELANDLAYGIKTIRLRVEHAKAEEGMRLRTMELEAANKELESFSYSVSHDLRSPLRAIDGYARMILKKQADKCDQNMKDKLNIIRSNVEIMGKLIDDLLAFSRLNKEPLSVSLLSMQDIINDVWKEQQIINPDRIMALKINDMPCGWGDRALIKQVYANLLDNAVKFTNKLETANIEAGGYTSANEHVYYVKDNGAGFDMEYYNKLFGVFQRLHSVDDGFEGTGIGLATVQRIIHRHSGRVWAEGKIEEGAIFYFTLPRRD